MPYKYKITRTRSDYLPFGQIRKEVKGENLTGFINGDTASDIEERFSKALYNDPRVDSFEFRVPVISGRNRPGQLEVDFMVNVGPITYPIQVDGEYAHKTRSKKEDDERKDALVNEYLRQFGAMPVQRIPGDDLSTQEDANEIVKGLIV